MSRLEETNALIDHMTELVAKNPEFKTADLQLGILMDIAKSLAVIADKLSEVKE